MNGEGGDGGGGAGGGEEDPSRLRVEKVGISALPKDITRRLPEVEGGDRRWQSGRRGGVGGCRGGGSTSARAAWLVAARWLRRALAAAPRLRRRRRPAAWLPGAGGEDIEVEAVEPGVGVTISSLVLVRPMEVVIERVALPPVSSTLWKISNSPVNSSLILLQISELNGARIGAQFGCPLTTEVNSQLSILLNSTDCRVILIFHF